MPSAERLRTSAICVTENVEHTLGRTGEVDDVVQAFVAEPGRADRLRAAARGLAECAEGPAGCPPLYGIPVWVKNSVHVDGLPIRAGSALWADLLTGRRAAVVDRLLEAGAVIAGKTVTAEFAVAVPAPCRRR
ncbi:amidase family protein [Streptomyces dangxiongensis]|uniref:amidase family protein n=1 Tax=Streptomyces dangxiongensis TaxID=1442032 RepID=UPI001F08FF42|nr:amidase family protein [Streptomyces dangxiongensis]